ncbi:hypothetical protein KDA11_03035 [Candidatus Saccharibacteria bacterium]|nr:hypothetical protein [Candidatus Saccharibacteria bacterium]
MKHFKKIIKKYKNINTRSLLIVPLVALMVTLVNVSQAFAGNASIKFSPSNVNVQKDANFTISINEDSGSESVNTVEIKLNYDASKVQFLSVDTGGGAFDICPSKEGGNGIVSIGCSKISAQLTGQQYVGKITFKAIAGSGSSALSLAGGDYGSGIFSSNDNSNVWNGATTGPTINFSSPAVNNSNNSGGSGGSSNQGNSSAPSSSNSGNNGGGSGQSKPNTSNNSSASSGGAGGTSSGGNSGGGSNGNQSVVQQPADYDDGGNSMANSDLLSGSVDIRIVDTSGQPAVGVTVTIDNQTAVTNDSGIVSFIGLKPGKYKIEAKGVLGVATKEVTITENSGLAVSPQSFELQLKKQVNFKLIGASVVAVIVLIILVFLIVRWKNNRPLRPSGSSKHKAIINNGGVSNTAIPSMSNTNTTIAPVLNTPDITPSTLNEVPPSNDSGRQSVVATDTLEQIEKKVGVNRKNTANSNMPTMPTGPAGGQIIRPTQSPSNPV